MKNRVQRRLLLLVLTIVLMALGVASLTVKSQWQAKELAAQLNQVDSESFQIADQFKDYLRELNDSLYQYGRSHTDPDVAAFNNSSRQLDLWIEAQSPKLTTDHEKVIMRHIQEAYHEYLRVARELVARLVAIGSPAASIDEYNSLRQESQRLSDLVSNLSRAHFASRNLVLASANHSIRELRVLVLVSLSLLLLFALALGVGVYRDMIMPLRVKLVESETLRERQEKLASLGVLAAGVAHEIRNPLTAIKAALFIQQKKFTPGSEEAADARVIDREILRLERIVNDFLLFAHPGDSPLAPISAASPLREVHALLAPQLARDNIQLLLAQAPPLEINADEDQIKQVLINLVRNAAEAIDRNGIIKLRLRAARKKLGSTETDAVILEVEDNGKGISPEVQKRLFDPFFTTKDTGTGLGLSIAGRIVQRHGGELEYQTAPGLGTTFSIVLPTASAQPDARAD